jgi:hypothetical protein
MENCENDEEKLDDLKARYLALADFRKSIL